MSTVQRDNQFKIRLSDEEMGWVDVIAESNGLTKADAMRVMIRREYQRISRTKK